MPDGTLVNLSVHMGVTVATVTASDRDTQFPDNDFRFQMFASQLASDYFAVDSLTGNIFVKRDLTLDTSQSHFNLFFNYFTSKLD